MLRILKSSLLWIGFAGCLAVALAAMGWVSLTALRLEQAESKANRQAMLEENVRLALWRMDSALAPVIAQESARPYFAFSTFLPVNRAYERMFNVSPGQVLMPSPLLAEPLPLVLAHFQFDPDGKLTSPRVPSQSDRRLAVPRYLSEETVRKAKEQLARLAAVTDRDRLIALLPFKSCEPAELVSSQLSQTSPLSQQVEIQQRRQTDLQTRGRGAVEFNERSQLILNNGAMLSQAMNLPPAADSSPGTTDVSGVLMTPLWLDGNLVLARRISVGGRQYVQGCLLDWPAIRAWLLASVDDLLPAADLRPLSAATPQTQSRRLAALPVELAAGEVPFEAGPWWSPVRLSLAAAWGGMLAAAAAVAMLLAGVVRLSNRRAAFVSAVTHELRTPLTTFHMYTEMLAEGMVPAPQQQEYLRTLRAEASRLSHLVENVLAYARLERGRPGGAVELVGIGLLLEPIRGRLADRAAQAGMELVVEEDDAAFAATVQASPSVVDQILFNLIDNACKYAAGATDRRIHLTARRRGDAVQLIVRDHGPGILRSRSRRLFSAFSKSAREAANSAPGVGLGLALSRRLARGMGARLDHDASIADGACFTLTLAGK